MILPRSDGFSMWALCCALSLLLTTPGPAAAQDLPSFDVVLVGLDGSKAVLGPVGSAFAPRVSPDGKRVAFENFEPSPNGPLVRLWTADISTLDARRPLPPVTSGPRNFAAVWTHDGERLVFLVSGEQPDAIFWRRADGTGEAERLSGARSAEAWTPGGKQLTFLTLRGNGDYGISLLDMQTRAANVLVDLPGSAQHSSSVSPDGRWVAYASNETGRFEIWVEPLPQTGERHRVTMDGGGHPLWSRDGSSIYFDRAQQLFEVDIDTSTGFNAGEAIALPISGFEQGEYRRQFDLMPNGEQFLMLFPAASAAN